MRLSVAIITFNEEAKLGRTLQAAAQIADEIVIVDSYSSDKTLTVAADFKARIFQREWSGFSDQKNYLLDQCKGDWVLLIDADEVLTPELIAEIDDILKENGKGAQIYEIPFESYCFGKLVRYGGWSNFYKIRLFERGAVRFGGEKVHEKFLLEPSKKKAKAKNYLMHCTYEDMEECLEKFNRYSSAGAQDLFQKGKKPSVFKLLTNPIWMFIQRYLIKRGFLDGVVGLILAIFVFGYHFAKYAKLYQLHWHDSDR